MRLNNAGNWGVPRRSDGIDCRNGVNVVAVRMNSPPVLVQPVRTRK
jgi:hypothetical protein